MLLSVARILFHWRKTSCLFLPLGGSMGLGYYQVLPAVAACSHMLSDSDAFSCCHLLSLVSYICRLLPAVFSYCQKLPAVAVWCQLFLAIINCCQLFLAVVNCSQLLPAFFISCLLLPAVVSSCLYTSVSWSVALTDKEQNWTTNAFTKISLLIAVNELNGKIQIIKLMSHHWLLWQ